MREHKNASEAVSHSPWIRRQEKMKKDELEKQAPFNISPHGPSREHRAETAAPANAMCNANNQSLLYHPASLKISKSRDRKQKR